MLGLLVIGCFSDLFNIPDTALIAVKPGAVQRSWFYQMAIGSFIYILLLSSFLQF